MPKYSSDSATEVTKVIILYVADLFADDYEGSMNYVERGMLQNGVLFVANEIQSLLLGYLIICKY